MLQKKAEFEITKHSKKPRLSPEYLKKFYAEARKAGVRTAREMSMFRMSYGLEHKPIQEALAHMLLHKLAIVSHHQDVVSKKAAKLTPGQGQKRMGVVDCYTVEKFRECGALRPRKICIGRFHGKTLAKYQRQLIIPPAEEPSKMKVPEDISSESPEPPIMKLDNSTSTWEYLIDKHVPRVWKRHSALLEKLTHGPLAGELNNTDLELLAEMLALNSNAPHTSLGEAADVGSKKTGYTPGLETVSGGGDMPTYTVKEKAMPLFGAEGLGAFEMSSTQDGRSPLGYGRRLGEGRKKGSETPGHPTRAKRGSKYEPTWLQEEKRELRRTKKHGRRLLLGENVPEQGTEDVNIAHEPNPDSAKDRHGRTKYGTETCSPFPRYSGECYHSCPTGIESVDDGSKTGGVPLNWATARQERKSELEVTAGLTTASLGVEIGKKGVTPKMNAYDTIPLDAQMTTRALYTAKLRAERCLKRARYQSGSAGLTARSECPQLDAVCLQISGGPVRGATTLGSDQSHHPPQLVVEVERNRRRRDCGPVMNLRTDYYPDDKSLPKRTNLIKRCEAKVANAHATKHLVQDKLTDDELAAGNSTVRLKGDKKKSPTKTSTGCDCIFPFVYGNQKHFKCIRDFKTNKPFCMVSDVKLTGKTRQVQCGKENPSVQPTGRWDYCREYQFNALGKKMSLFEFEYGKKKPANEKNDGDGPDEAVLRNGVEKDRQGRLMGSEPELDHKAAQKKARIPDKKTGLTKEADQKLQEYKKATGQDVEDSKSKFKLEGARKAITSIDDIPPDAPGIGANADANQKMAKLNKKVLSGRGREAKEVKGKIRYWKKPVIQPKSILELLEVTETNTDHADPYPGCKLVCPRTTGLNLSKRLQQGHDSLKDGKKLIQDATGSGGGEIERAQKVEAAMVDKALQIKELKRKKKSTGDIGEIDIEIGKVTAEREKLSKADHEIMSDGSIDAKYVQKKQKAFQEGFVKGQAANGKWQNKESMEIVAKMKEGREKHLDYIEGNAKRKTKWLQEKDKKREMSEKEQWKVDKKTAESKAKINKSIKSSLASGAEEIVEEAKMKQGPEKNAKIKHIPIARRVREKTWKADQLRQKALVAREKKLKAKLKSAEFKRKNKTEKGEKKLQDVKTQLSKVMARSPNPHTNILFNELIEKQGQLESDKKIGFQHHTRDLSAWERKKERYGKLVHRFNVEAAAKKQYRERSRKELVMKEAHKLADDEKVLKTKVRHNNQVRAWNARAMELNKKRDKCRDRRQRNVDVKVLSAADSGFVMANRPHQAVSALPQNEEIRDYLRVQKDWQYTFIKFDLPHDRSGQDEDSELGEGQDFDPNVKNKDAIYNNPLMKDVKVKTNPNIAPYVPLDPNGGLNIVPDEKKKKWTVDAMAGEYDRWQALAYQNELNGYHWHKHFPGKWWIGLSRDETFNKLATAQSKQRVMPGNPAQDEPHIYKPRTRLDNVNERIKSNKWRYDGPLYRRRRYLYPKWYVDGETNQQFIPKTVPSRRRAAPGYVDPLQEGWEVKKAGVRVFKYGDEQAAPLVVKVSSCDWTRNTLVWGESRAMVRNKEDKYSHIKRMLYRENQIKLKLKGETNGQPNPTPRGPPLSELKAMKKGYVEQDDDDRHSTTWDLRMSGKRSTEKQMKKEALPEHRRKPSAEWKKNKKASLATPKKATRRRPGEELLEEAESKPNDQEPSLGEAESAGARTRARAKAGTKGLFDGVGYTYDWSDIKGRSPSANAATPTTAKPFSYDQIYTKRHITTESTYPKEIRELPSGTPDQSSSAHNFAPRSLCKCVKPFFAAAKKECRKFQAWKDNTETGRQCGSLRYKEWFKPVSGFKIGHMDYYEKPSDTVPQSYEVCCKWVPLTKRDVHIKYCSGETQFRLKIHLPGNTKPVWREFSPPNKALMGSCNNYVRILALAFRYGGNDFKRELRHQAKLMAYQLKMKKWALYKKSKAFVTSANTNEVRAKVGKLDSHWEKAMSAHTNAWSQGLKYRSAAWRKWSMIFCLLPAAFPMFTLFPVKFPLPMLRFSTCDCCWAWPLNGDCPICLVYGPSIKDTIMEAINLAKYMFHKEMKPYRECGQGIHRGNSMGQYPDDMPCAGDGAITHEQANSHEQTKAAQANSLNQAVAEEGRALVAKDPSLVAPVQAAPDPEVEMPASWNGKPSKVDASGLGPNSVPESKPAVIPADPKWTFKKATRPSAIDHHGLKKSQKVSDGHGDGGGEELGEGNEGSWDAAAGEMGRVQRDYYTREVMDGGTAEAPKSAHHAKANAAVTNLKQVRSKSKLEDRYKIDSTDAPAPVSSKDGARSQPGWHAKHASWMVDGAVQGRRTADAVAKRAVDPDEAVRKWMGEVREVSVKTRERAVLQQKWKKMSLAQKRAVVAETEAHKTPVSKRAAERHEKVERAFARDGKTLRYTKVISHLGIHPMATVEGPLPMGWHKGKSRGVTYFWNDSGAKQLHYPSVPMPKAEVDLGEDTSMSDQTQGEVGKMYLKLATMNGVDLKKTVQKDPLGNGQRGPAQHAV